MPELLSPRTCCLDLDTFFVSVERLLDPSLVGLPVVVGGMGGRGVVTSASYEVRKLGVHAGMPGAQARRLAPQAIFLPGHHGVYSEHAGRVKAVIERWSPVVQTASIDEFFLDFHGCERLYRRADDDSDDATILRVVAAMRAEVLAETGLPCSAGIGATRPIAKMASGAAKPAGELLVAADAAEAWVAARPIRKFPGIGPVAEARMVAVGITTLGDLLALPPGPLRNRFGLYAESVRRAVWPNGATTLGRDRPAFREHDPEGDLVGSISNERTFAQDIGDDRALADQVRALVERVCWRVRRRGGAARTVTLKLRFSDFQTITRSRSIAPTADEAVVLATALDLLRAGRTRRQPIRLLGVGLSHFVGADRQLGLPFRATERPAVAEAIDAVRTRFGYDAVRLGTGSHWERRVPGG